MGRETEKLEETGDHSWFFPKRVSGWKERPGSGMREPQVMQLHHREEFDYFYAPD